MTIDKLILYDLKKMRYTLSTDYIRKQFEKSKKIKIKSKTTSKMIRFNKIKYKLPNIKLKGKYLQRYNDLLNKDNILYLDLLESGYYEYDLGLKQHLKECGLNRVKQLYGTCWLDSTINIFIFGKRIKNRLLELLNYYAKSNNIKNIKEFISNINNKQIKLNKTVNKNQKKIFSYLISILYKVFCLEGIRNTKLSKHDNFILTNFAINIRNYNQKKYKKDVLKPENIAYNSYYANEHIIYIFNKYIDPLPHLLYYKDSNTYSFENTNHINQLYLTIGTRSTYINGGYGYYHNFKNIDIKLNSKNINFTSGDSNIKSLDNIDFIVFSCTDMKNKLAKVIPTEIVASVNNVKTKFKLDSAAISILYGFEKGFEDDIGHALTGLICQGEYYIYDSNNNYFKIDWTNLTGNNITAILNYYKIIYTAQDVNNDNKLYTNARKYKEPKVDIYIEYATYYNTQLNFSFKMNTCNPHRQKE
jgi:hypothetical protein